MKAQPVKFKKKKYVVYKVKPGTTPVKKPVIKEVRKINGKNNKRTIKR